MCAYIYKRCMPYINKRAVKFTARSIVLGLALYYASSTAACAAAKRAIGTRKGEHET